MDALFLKFVVVTPLPFFFFVGILLLKQRSLLFVCMSEENSDECIPSLLLISRTLPFSWYTWSAIY